MASTEMNTLETELDSAAPAPAEPLSFAQTEDEN
jgi:hypothetical protein